MSDNALKERDVATQQPQLSVWVDADATATEAASSWFSALNPAGDGDSTSSSDSASTSDNGDDAEIEPTNTALSEAMEDTERILDQLIRLGLTIRKSSPNVRLRTADSSFRQDNYQDLQRHLTLFLMLEAESYNSKRDKSADQRLVDTGVGYQQLSRQKKHLILANLRRRHRFVYARHHQKTLKGSLDIETVRARETKRASRPANTTKSTTPSQTVAESIKNEPPLQRTVYAPRPGMTIATALPAEEDVFKALPAYSRAESSVSVTTAKLSYPPPPPTPYGVKSFKCPCCYQALPIMFSEKARWRKHLSEDLSPYTCPFDDCPETSVLYATRSPWRTHINKQHGASHYWECLPCHGAEIFNNAESFVAHTRTCHGDTIATTQLSDLQQLCRRTVPPQISTCPLCDLMQLELDPAAMIEHIGDCIHEFSLKALPWAESNDTIAFYCPSSTTEKVSRWLDASGQPSLLDEHQINLRFFSSAVPAPAQDQPFVLNEYFNAAEDTDSGSAGWQPTPSDDDLPSAEFSSMAEHARSEHNELDPDTEHDRREQLEAVVPLASGLSESDDDNISLTSTVEDYYHPPDTSSIAREVLAEGSADGRRYYLIEWLMSPLDLHSTFQWEPEESVGSHLMKRWEKEKAKHARLKSSPLKINFIYRALLGLDEEREKRHQQRNAKRERKGLPTTSFSPRTGSDLLGGPPGLVPDASAFNSEVEDSGFEDATGTGTELLAPAQEAEQEDGDSTNNENGLDVEKQPAEWHALYPKEHAPLLKQWIVKRLENKYIALTALPSPF